ncbi:MAG: tRNA lysidine(34) synthetase TilS [Acidobacteriota bacterium]
MLKTIRLHRLLTQGDRVIVALSGGPDSVALLLALRSMCQDRGWQIRAAHVNHGLRGQASDGDEAFVRELCRQKNVPLDVRTLSGLGPTGPTNLEGRARQKRYRFFFQLARRQGARIATGHTLNDQAETFFMKVARGAGPTGLSGIFPIRDNRVEDGADREPARVIRPLLEATRPQVLDYLRRQDQVFRQDASNRDLGLDRNWVRHRLLPAMAQRLNPQIVQTVGRTCHLLREVTEFLEQSGISALEQCRVNDSEGVLNVDRLRSLPAILRKEVARLWLKQSRGALIDISYQHVDDVLALLEGTSGRETSLPGGVRVVREFQSLRLLPGPPPEDFEKNLKIPGEICVVELGTRIRAYRTKALDEQKRGVLLNFAGDSLRVRNRRPGDRYCTDPGVCRKLKDLFQEQRIPKSRRSRLLILEVKGKILWVEGFLPHPDCRVDPTMEQAVEIEIQPETFEGERGP